MFQRIARSDSIFSHAWECSPLACVLRTTAVLRCQTVCRNDVFEEVSQGVMQDQALQQRIREGDNAAFAKLYSCHKQGVYLYCTRFLGDQPAAEDIFQEVFINLLERIRGRIDDSDRDVLDMLMIAKYLERIGDHAANVGNWVAFSVNGELLPDN